MSSPVVPPPLATISAVSPRPVPSVAFASAPRTSSASATAGWPRSQARYSRSLPCPLRTAPTGALCTSATAHSVAPLDTAAATPVSHASTASSSSSQPSPPISDARCSRMRSLLRRRRRRSRSVSRRSRSAIDIASRNTRARNGLGLWRRTNPEMAKLAPQAKHSPEVAPKKKARKRWAPSCHTQRNARAALAPPAPGAPQADWRDAGGRPERRGAIDIASRITRPIKTSTMQTGL